MKERKESRLADHEQERKCEFGDGKTATHYGGWQYANDWAGYVCAEHAARLPWSEPLPPKSK